MELKSEHGWPTTKSEAIGFQKERAGQVDLQGNNNEPALIAAVDTAYGFGGEKLYASVVVVTFPKLQEVERVYHFDTVNFPYHPGLFYFREGPVILEALTRLVNRPDILIVHGHGTAHPKRIGMACHIGLDFDLPTIGCVRKLLAGTHRPVGEAKGSSQLIVLFGKEVGLAYRSKDKVKPIFISPGYKCDLPFARDIIVKCLRGYRLPEPLRMAHLFANKYKRHIEKDQKSPSREFSEET
ncbi:MAG: endonuclease V [candidate division Zixibacteria bacterium]|nr:endonuclease V [candidate division Zixibacteria bacterium]